LYTDAESLRAVEARLFPGSTGQTWLCERERGEGHVLLVPALTHEQLAVVGLPATTADALVLAGAEATIVGCSPVARDDPWLSRIFAFCVLETLRNAKGVWSVDAGFDARRFSAWSRAARGDDYRLEQRLADAFDLGNEFSVLYADEVACVVSWLLDNNRSRFASKLLAKPKRGASVDETRVAVVEGVLGKSWRELEERIGKLMAGGAPRWAGQVQPERRDDRLLFAGTGGKLGRPGIMAASAPPEGDFAIRTRAEFTTDDDVVAFRIGQDGTSALSIELKVGSVETARDGYADDTRDELGSARAEIARGVPFDVAIELAGDVVVRIDGAVAMQFAAGDRDPHGFGSVGHVAGLFWLDEPRVDPLKGRRR
jgi:hypothetical protein